MINDNGQKSHKLTDAQFWSALRENGGLFARTAKCIRKRYNINYTRQAVRKRATATPEALAELEDIREEAQDLAEEVLHILMRSGKPETRLQAVKLFLSARAKNRGYGSGVEINAITGGNEPAEQKQGALGGGLCLTIRVAE